ncbi:hypothetical protein [Pasteuria penetrans]|uniref:hypothetical protein n=1 Tax=Pasteuria penetrans TaxID=86005 RepID=UPI001CAA5A18|nr:hypothetical protein [Pasteuria penetrans]
MSRASILANPFAPPSLQGFPHHYEVDSTLSTEALVYHSTWPRTGVRATVPRDSLWGPN